MSIDTLSSPKRFTRNYPEADSQSKMNGDHQEFSSQEDGFTMNFTGLNHIFSYSEEQKAQIHRQDFHQQGLQLQLTPLIIDMNIKIKYPLILDSYEQIQPNEDKKLNLLKYILQMIKILKHFEACRYQPLLNMKRCQFSKKLKQKIKHELKNQRSDVEEAQQSYLRSYPNIQPSSFAQKKGLDIVLQFLPVFLELGTCLLVLSQPYSGFYIYNLFGAEKFLALIMLANINFPSESLQKFALISGIIVPLFIPITSFYGMGTQIIQLLVILLNDQKKIDQGSYLTKQQKELISKRAKLKFLIYVSAIAIFSLKGIYHYTVYQFDRKIREFNEKNKGSVASSNQNSSST